MSVAHRFELILLLLAAALFLDRLARRMRLPPAGALILGGIALALIPGMPRIELDPDLALILFLPPLLQSDAYLTSWRDFRANLSVILHLAIGLVVFTTLVVGIAAHLAVPGLPWAACFALGAIVSPPDAVAAKAVLNHVRLPRQLVVLLEGESLVNDGSGLALYRFAVVAGLTGAFNIWHAAASFVLLSIGGILVGLLIGYAASLILARMRDPILATAGSFLMGWGAYIGAEFVGVSGVLATVAAGLLLGWRQHETIPAPTRLIARASWEVMTFILESLVFILMGLSLRGAIERLDGRWGGLADIIGPALAVVAAAIVSRFLWVFPAIYVARVLFPSIRRKDPYPPASVPIVIGWAGMRGVVSLAAALALPDHFPGRDFITVATLAVILVTVLVQGATLAPLIRLLRLDRFEGGQMPSLRESEARARMALAQLNAIRRASDSGAGVRLHPRLVEQYAFRARSAAEFSASEQQFESRRHAHFGAILTAIRAGREEIVRLHRDGEIHDSILHTLETELDLEEMSVRQFTAEPD